MKTTRVTILWPEGLHLRPAARLVHLAQASQSLICVKVGEKIADTRSILALLLLCATVGTVVDLEITGADEDRVVASVTQIFSSEASREES